MPINLKAGVIAALCTIVPAHVLADPVALLIGNNDYDNLPNANRAERIGPAGRALDAQGFDLLRLTNASSNRVRQALSQFEAAAADGDGAVVFLSGRFVHSATETYFLTEDARTATLEAARIEGIPMSTILAILAESPGKSVLAMGHGAGFTPRSDYLSSGPGLLDAPQGVTIVSGPTADVVSVVAALASGEPALSPNALSGAGVAASGFLPASGALSFGDAPLGAPVSDPREAELGYWEAVLTLNTGPAYEAYLAAYPNGIYATEARERIGDLRDAPRREAEAAEAALNLTRDQRRNIQRALTLLDYDTRGIDGLFGRGSRAAISAFQSAEGFEPTGYLNRSQIRRLDQLARARGAELEEAARREAERTAAADRRFWQQTGESGREDDLRRYLQRYPDGIYSENARAEIRAIEELRRPRVSAVEQLTWQRVEEDGSENAYREYLRRYPNGAYADAAQEEISRLEAAAQAGNDRQAAAQGEERMNLSASTRRTIEARLETLDYNPGPVDGRFTNKTRNALLRYQQDRRLPATGYMNDATMVRILADTVISIFD